MVVRKAGGLAAWVRFPVARQKKFRQMMDFVHLGSPYHAIGRPVE